LGERQVTPVPQTLTSYPHITFNEKGRATLDGTRSKVTMVVRDHLEGGMSPQEIHEAYLDLPLASIHAALAYYYDHKAELDAEMEQSDREAEEALKYLDSIQPRLTRTELERRLKEKGERK
jgi:uncharacterized protein (DUF433 family)